MNSWSERSEDGLPVTGKNVSPPSPEGKRIPRPAIARKDRIAAVLLALVLVFALFSLAGERGFLSLIQMNKRRGDLASSVRDLEGDNARLSEEITRLRSDPGTIESLARTKLGMVRPGEVVFVFSDDGGEAGK